MCSLLKVEGLKRGSKEKKVLEAKYEIFSAECSKHPQRNMSKCYIAHVDCTSV
jgi:hypothetical protein